MQQVAVKKVFTQILILRFVSVSLRTRLEVLQKFPLICLVQEIS